MFTLAYQGERRIVDYIMQAGDRLNFIQPFDPLETEKSSNDAEKERNVVVFSLILKRLVFDRPELVQSFEVLEESGFVTVFEASYRLDLPDGSHLHIVAFGHQDEAGLLDAGLSVNEHFADGKYNGGYLYEYTADGLRRSTNHPDAASDDEEDFDEPGMSDYFSIADIYQSRDQLEEAILSDDMEVTLLRWRSRKG